MLLTTACLSKTENSHKHSATYLMREIYHRHSLTVDVRMCMYLPTMSDVFHYYQSYYQFPLVLLWA